VANIPKKATKTQKMQTFGCIFAQNRWFYFWQPLATIHWPLA